MPIDFRQLYDEAQNTQQEIDPNSRQSIQDLIGGRVRFDARDKLAGALDNPEGEQSIGSKGLQDAIGKTPDGPQTMGGGTPVPSVGPQGQQLLDAQGLSGNDRPNPSPQAPPPMSGQPSRLPPPSPQAAGPGGALGGPSPAGAPPQGLAPAPQQMAPQNPGISGNIGAAPPAVTQRAQMPSVTPPQAPGTMPGAMPNAQGANGNQPQLDPQAVAAIGQATPEQLQQTMQMMQKTWEQQQIKNRMAMGRQ